MTVSRLGYPGLREKITINGTDLAYDPNRAEVSEVPLESVFTAASGKIKIFSRYPVLPSTAPYSADLLTPLASYPDRLTQFSCDLPFRFQDGNAPEESALAVLKKLTKSTRLHALILWRPDYVEFTGKASQQVVYLQRRNAASYVSPNRESTFPMIVRVDGVEKTVVMQNTLTESTSVTAGEVWVHRTSTLMKLGTALTGAQLVEVEYEPLYFVRAFSGDVSIDQPGIEPISVRLVESV